MIELNKYARGVIKRLFRNGAATRSEIMRSLKMRLNSIVDVCNELEDLGLIVREESVRRRNGRLMLNPERFIFIGGEHRIDGISLTAVDVTGKKLCHRTLGLPRENRLDHLFSAVDGFVSKFSGERICALGFSDIGLVDPSRGVGIYSAHLSEWRDVPLGERFRQRFPYEFFLIDRVDADCFAAHPGNGCEPHIYVTVIPDGIGMSLRDSSHIWRSRMPFAGQIGHLTAVPNGPLCRCGNRGCLETVSSVTAVLKQLSEVVGKRLTEAGALKLAASGDHLCETVLREAGEHMGEILAKVVGILGIGTVTLRGTLCDSSGPYFAGARAALFKEVIYPLNQKLSLDSEPRSADNSALGAALFARGEYFDHL